MTHRILKILNVNMNTFSIRNFRGREAVGQYVQNAEEKKKNCQPKNPVSGKLACKSKTKIKAFVNITKLRLFIITRPALKEVFKGILKREIKGH